MECVSHPTRAAQSARQLGASASATRGSARRSTLRQAARCANEWPKQRETRTTRRSMMMRMSDCHRCCGWYSWRVTDAWRRPWRRICRARYWIRQWSRCSNLNSSRDCKLDQMQRTNKRHPLELKIQTAERMHRRRRSNMRPPRAAARRRYWQRRCAPRFVRETVRRAVCAERWANGTRPPAAAARGTNRSC